MKLGAILVAVPLVGALRAALGGVRTSRGAALRATVEKPAVSESPVRTTAADDVYVLTEEDPRPGLEENEVFRCDDSVAFWRDFQRDGPEDAASNFRRAAEVASAGLASGGAKAVVYWASHAARTASGSKSSTVTLGLLLSLLAIVEPVMPPPTTATRK